QFEALDDVVSTLDRLGQRNPPLVAVLPRQPGTKESRYVHLFSGEAPPHSPEAASVTPARTGSGDSDRLARLESEVLDLRQQVSDLEQQIAEFRKQFE